MRRENDILSDQMTFFYLFIIFIIEVVFFMMNPKLFSLAFLRVFFRDVSILPKKQCLFHININKVVWLKIFRSRKCKNDLQMFRKYVYMNIESIIIIIKLINLISSWRIFTTPFVLCRIVEARFGGRAVTSFVIFRLTFGTSRKIM